MSTNALSAVAYWSDRGTELRYVAATVYRGGSRVLNPSPDVTSFNPRSSLLLIHHNSSVPAHTCSLRNSNTLLLAPHTIHHTTLSEKAHLEDPPVFRTILRSGKLLIRCSLVRRVGMGYSVTGQLVGLDGGPGGALSRGTGY